MRFDALYLKTAGTFVEVMESHQRMHQTFHRRRRLCKRRNCTDKVGHTIRRVSLKNGA